MKQPECELKNTASMKANGDWPVVSVSGVGGEWWVTGDSVVSAHEHGHLRWGGPAACTIGDRSSGLLIFN